MEGNSQELFARILQEKENYIMRLEQEQSDMRKEIELLKEKLIQYEIGIMSGGGNIRSYQPSALKNQSSFTSHHLTNNHNSRSLRNKSNNS